MQILLQKKTFREADTVAERTEWMGLLMPIKRKAGCPGVTPSPMFQENVELRTWTVKSIEKMQEELLISPLRGKSRDMSKSKIK